MHDHQLKDKVIFITGSSRGIGSEMAKKFAADGAKVIITGRTDKPHPLLKGTIFSVAEEITSAGGIALPIAIDVRNSEAIEAAFRQAADTFGGIDILVNNASIMYLSPTLITPAKRLDMMFNTITRATFLCSQAAFPYLKNAKNPHILNLSPPINLQSKWLKDHTAYTVCKYGASLCTIGMSAEFKPHRIAVNSLWPRVTIATSAVEVHAPSYLPGCRHAGIMVDAAYEIITSDSQTLTGNLFIDEYFLRERGYTEFTKYAINVDIPGALDLYIDF